MKKLTFTAKAFIFFIIFVSIIIIGLYTYAYFTPKIGLKKTNQLYIYDNKENIIYQGSGSSKWVDLKNISSDLINAILSTEDKNFYNHQGFDFKRIIKALFLNVKNGKIVQGASTISQQYIKNLYLDFDKTWSRKIEEALLTLNLEVHYDKDDILEGYLNTINFGQGNYGVEDASLYYFNKKAKDLTTEEAIMLTGIPKSPSNYNPVSNLSIAKKRAKIVAKGMLKNKVISQKDYNKLNFDKVKIYGKRTSNNLDTLMYYQDSVIKELESIKKIPASLIETGSLKIYTYLDLETQTAMENSIKANMLNDDTQVASIVVNPKNGGVLALSGGKNYAASQFNRVTQAKRQVGSTMKPILYYAALENGFTSSSTFTSEKTTFVFGKNQTYEPNNYNNIYGNKPITMAAAIAYSDNIYAVKTHLFLGEEALVNMAKKMGLKGKLEPNASLALGTSEISMYDFARMYNTLASGGYKRNLKFIKKIEDEKGNILYKSKNENNLVLNPDNVFILNELLTSTYNYSFVNYNKPTALSIAPLISRKYSVKSGSTGTDFWIVGYNPNVLTIVWNGLDNSKVVDTKYATISKKIWAETSEGYVKDKEKNWYEVPDNVIGKQLDPITGKESNTSNVLFYFIKGSENANNNIAN